MKLALRLSQVATFLIPLAFAVSGQWSFAAASAVVVLAVHHTGRQHRTLQRLFTAMLLAMVVVALFSGGLPTFAGILWILSLVNLFKAALEKAAQET